MPRALPGARAARLGGVSSRRAAWDLAPNPLAQAVERRRAGGPRFHDLSDANPTRAGLSPQAALAAALARLAGESEALRYQPDPRGQRGAREAIAAYHAQAGTPVDPEQVLLLSGTSEGYAHLFRVLADPGDRVHLPAPGYALFDHLAELEGLEVAHYPLLPPARGARWRVDRDALAAGLGPRSRAIVVIHPHNPTGSFVDPEDLESLASIAVERGLALVSDEVFADSALRGAGVAGLLSLEARAGDPLRFVLSGASKVVALPQLKLGWLVAAGPAAARDEALARLEFVADAFLSVSPLAAHLLPELLAQRAPVQQAIRARVAGNRARLERALAPLGHVGLLPAEAGWAAILALEGSRDEQALALGLLEDADVLVQPGFSFDLPERDAAGAARAHLVLSLLAEPERFAQAAEALASGLGVAPPERRSQRG